MRILSLLVMTAAVVAGCSSYPSNVDDNFGKAVTGLRAQQVIDPDAPSRRKPPAGIDGQAAKSSVDRYQKSFDTPPPPVNVLNIGIGSSSGGQ